MLFACTVPFSSAGNPGPAYPFTRSEYLHTALQPGSVLHVEQGSIKFPKMERVRDMKGYHEENYPVSIRVRVTAPEFPDRPWVDGIKGLSVGHAMWRAGQNWDGAEIEFLSVD